MRLSAILSKVASRTATFAKKAVENQSMQYKAFQETIKAMPTNMRRYNRKTKQYELTSRNLSHESKEKVKAVAERYLQAPTYSQGQKEIREMNKYIREQNKTSTYQRKEVTNLSQLTQAQITASIDKLKEKYDSDQIQTIIRDVYDNSYTTDDESDKQLILQSLQDAYDAEITNDDFEQMMNDEDNPFYDM